MVSLLGGLEVAGDRRHITPSLSIRSAWLSLADDLLVRGLRLSIVNILLSRSNLGNGSVHVWSDLRGSGHGVGRMDPCRHGKTARNRVWLALAGSCEGTQPRRGPTSFLLNVPPFSWSVKRLPMRTQEA